MTKDQIREELFHTIDLPRNFESKAQAIDNIVCGGHRFGLTKSDIAKCYGNVGEQSLTQWAKNGLERLIDYIAENFIDPTDNGDLYVSFGKPSRCPLAKAMRVSRISGYPITKNALLHQWECWKSNYRKSGYLDAINGYHVFTPLGGCNDFSLFFSRYDATKGVEWQETYGSSLDEEIGAISAEISQGADWSERDKRIATQRLHDIVREEGWSVSQLRSWALQEDSCVPYDRIFDY